MSDKELFICTATNAPNNIFKRFGAEFRLEASKARVYERKGLVTILRRPQRPTAKAISPAVNPKARCMFFVFLGEMGYEILSSHGWLRKLKREHPEITIGIVSRAGVHFLYEGACDIYVEIKDVLAEYMSDCFGLDLKRDHKEIVYNRCADAAAKRGIAKENIQLVYSTSAYAGYGIKWGKHNRVASMAYKIHDTFLQQDWVKLTLKGYEQERRALSSAYPQLRAQRYCVIHDRRRCCSWGHEMVVPASTYLQIIDKLKAAGYLVVLFAYKPWKHQDAESLFYQERFKNIPGTINMTEFFNANIENNMLYQALVLQGADWQLSPWGTAGKLPCLVGKPSYMLTIGRKQYSTLAKTAVGWNKALVRCGGRVHALESVAEHDSIMTACTKAGLFRTVVPSLKSKVTVLIPTNWVPSCPGTKLVETVIKSIERIPALDGCRCVIGYDVPKENTEQHKEYARNLLRIQSKLNIEVKCFVNAQQRKSFLSLIRECKTDYFLFWEHDWDFKIVPDLAGVVETMNRNETVNVVYFSKRDNINGAKMGDKQEILSPGSGMLKTNRWSNNPHLCRRSKWNEWMPIVEKAPLQWPGQKPSKQIEPALHFKYLEEIERDGFEKAHARWGMYVYGKIGDKAMVRHLDGKAFR